jgi:2-oxoisovalerate dehydrogenase E1 component
MTGARPVIDFMFADFVMDSVGEIVNQIAKMQYMSSGRLKMPILLRGCIGIGHSAATHHSGNYYAMFAHFPGLRVVVPSTPFDAKGLLLHALACDDPVLFLEHRELLGLKGPVPVEDYEIEFGKAAIVRAGADLSIITYGAMVHAASEAADVLEKEGVSVEIVDLRTLIPLDEQAILDSVRKTSKVIVLHEASLTGGFGGEIAARISERVFEYLDAPVLRMASADTPVPFSPPLEEAFLPNATAIVEKARWLFRY